MYAFVILLYHAKEETTTKTGLISTPNAGMNTVFLNYLHSRPKLLLYHPPMRQEKFSVTLNGTRKFFLVPRPLLDNLRQTYYIIYSCLEEVMFRQTQRCPQRQQK